MLKLIDKPSMAEKRITQESLEQYNMMDLLLGMGCRELALFAEQYNKNLFKEFYANLSEEFNYCSWCGASFSTPSIQGHTPCKFTMERLSEKKQCSTKFPLPSPPHPSAESSRLTTSLDLLNEQLSSIVAFVLQMHYRFATALCIGIVLGNSVNPEESVITSCDMDIRLRKFESIRKGQNPKKNRSCRESKLEVLFWKLNP
ncbi:hypothetical protein M9H77_13087 [Catharanthus roseus]|uniref:Uncharacterized protein n=1 Tax=Catharanthus roseus TaxID=4058 RepID=A0ACC0BJC7_CATRO|nr:hypothetical protein M9H77_13087 [Catharanthus roseus]